IACRPPRGGADYGTNGAIREVGPARAREPGPISRANRWVLRSEDRASGFGIPALRGDHRRRRLWPSDEEGSQGADQLGLIRLASPPAAADYRSPQGDETLRALLTVLYLDSLWIVASNSG